MTKKQGNLKNIPGGPPKVKTVNLPGQPEYRLDPNEGKNLPKKKLSPVTTLPVNQKVPTFDFNPDGTRKKKGK